MTVESPAGAPPRRRHSHQPRAVRNAHAPQRRAPAPPNGPDAPAAAPPDVHDRRPPDLSGAIHRSLAPILKAGNADERNTAAARAAQELGYVVRAAGSGPRLASALEQLPPGKVEALVDAWNAVSSKDAATVFPAFADAVGQLDDPDKKRYLSQMLTYACDSIKNSSAFIDNPKAKADIDRAIRDLSARDVEARLRADVLVNDQQASAGTRAYKLAKIVRTKGITSEKLGQALGGATRDGVGGLRDALQALYPDDVPVVAKSLAEAFVRTPSSNAGYAVLVHVLLDGLDAHAGESPDAAAAIQAILKHGLAAALQPEAHPSSATSQ